MSHRWSMRSRLSVGERAFGTAQSLVDSPEYPQREGVVNLCCGARIRAEPIGEIAMARPVVELDGLLIMLMGDGKVAEIKAGGAGNAVRDQGLGAIRPGPGFAQEELGYLAHRCGFAAVQMPDPQTVIGGETLRGVLHLVGQFAGPRKGRAR